MRRLAFGIKAKKSGSGLAVTAREGMNIGVGIALVYAVSASLFFVIGLFLRGTELLESEAGT